MNLLIFRTDIKTKEEVKVINNPLTNHPQIDSWSIDMEDIDKVLRIEAQADLAEHEVISLVKTYGFECEVLPD